MKAQDISPHWFWLPFVLVVGQLLSRYFLSDETYHLHIATEYGAVELLTPLVLLPGIVFGALAVLKFFNQLPTRNSKIWLLMMTFGAFYLAGEEVSWGQWFFLWDTPDALLGVNDQNETNLHNIGTWFDQKPRLLLELWVLIAAFRAWYLSAKVREVDPNSTAYWFWPSVPLAWTGLLSALVMMPERIKDWWGIALPNPFDIRVTETQELVLGCYLSFYLVSVYLRLKARSAAV